MSDEMYKVVTKSGVTDVSNILSDLNWDWPHKCNGVLILDVDGTIRNGKHRLSLLPSPEEIEAAGDKPNIAFTKFNEMCHLDTPMFDVINVANMFKSKGYFTIILTACTHSAHALGTLLRQLREWSVEYDAVVMRGADNQLHPVEFKEQFLYASKIATSTIESVIAMDDCKNNCNMFRNYGILALQVEDYSRFNKGDTK